VAPGELRDQELALVAVGPRLDPAAVDDAGHDGAAVEIERDAARLALDAAEEADVLDRVRDLMPPELCPIGPRELEDREDDRAAAEDRAAELVSRRPPTTTSPAASRTAASAKSRTPPTPPSTVVRQRSSPVSASSFETKRSSPYLGSDRGRDVADDDGIAVRIQDHVAERARLVEHALPDDGAVGAAELHRDGMIGAVLDAGRPVGEHAPHQLLHVSDGEDVTGRVDGDVLGESPALEPVHHERDDVRRPARAEALLDHEVRLVLAEPRAATPRDDAADAVGLDGGEPLHSVAETDQHGCVPSADCRRARRRSLLEYPNDPGSS
jgi:hypothetical protein